MTPRQTFSLLLPFIAGSVHCISIQHNALKQGEQKTNQNFTEYDFNEQYLALDSIEYNAILKEYELEIDAQAEEPLR